MIVVVGVVILLISLAAYGFLTLMQVENLAARARGDRLQAAAVAESGREWLAAVLELPRSARPPEAESGDAAALCGGIAVASARDDRVDEAAVGRFALVAPQGADGNAQGWRFGYENESAKLHLAALLEFERAQPGSGRAALMNLPAMDESTADAILDWIDPDSAPREQGAESAYYTTLTPPLQPRQGVPPTLDELLLVRGVTRERLFGGDLDANFRVDDWETDLTRTDAAAPASAALDAGELPWCRFLTVYSGERDESYAGRPRIQLNQADLRALHRELSVAFEPAWANFIVAYRQFGPSAGGTTAVEASALVIDFSLPPKVTIASPVELISAQVTMPGETDDKKLLLTSPLADDPVQLRDYLPNLMDLVTVGSGAPRLGRINIQLAEREVLLAIPGFDSSLAERTISARTLVSSADAGRRHPVWLLTEGLVDRDRWRRIEPWVTAGGEVGRAQVVGFSGLRRAFVRFETVVDGTGAAARQLYYKDLRRLGPGPVDDLREVTQGP